MHPSFRTFHVKRSCGSSPWSRTAASPSQLGPLCPFLPESNPSTGGRWGAGCLPKGKCLRKETWGIRVCNLQFCMHVHTKHTQPHPSPCSHPYDLFTLLPVQDLGIAYFPPEILVMIVVKCAVTGMQSRVCQSLSFLVHIGRSTKN